MKKIRLFIPLLLVSVLVSCASHDWKTIRPMQERMITLELKTGYFGGASDKHVKTYVIPDKNETPEVRLVIVGRFNVSDTDKLQELSREIEEVVVGVMPFSSVIPRDTSRITIYLTGYDSSRKVMQYANRKWSEMNKANTDEELRNNAKWLQNKMAVQLGLE